jgi:hypothetical protein
MNIRMEVLMTHTEQVIANALAAVAMSRAERERDEERRKRVFGKIQIGLPLPAIKGQQLSLDLH